MFDNLGKNIVIRHSLPLEDILRPLWDVFIASKGFSYDFADISIPTNPDYNEDLNEVKKHISELINIVDAENKREYQDVVDSIQSDAYEIFSKIVLFLRDNITDNEKLDKSIAESAVLLYRQVADQWTTITQEDNLESYVKECSKLIEGNKLIETFYNIIMPHYENRQGLQEMSRNYICKSYIKNAILSEQGNAIQISSPIYESSKIRLTNVNLRRKRISSKSVWINKKLLSKKYGVKFSEKCNYYVVIDNLLPVNENVIAIQVGKYIFPMVSSISTYVKSINEYYWANIQYAVYHRVIPKEKEINVLSPSHIQLLEKFNKSAREDDLLYVLSHLIHNLYLPQDKLENDVYKEYFSPVLLAQNLKHLMNYEFLFRENDDQSALLATYQLNKEVGSTSYNLLHMLLQEGSISEDWTGPQTKSRPRVSNVYVLKPVVAFNFIQNFFESYFRTALNDCKITAVYNQNVQYENRENEIDVIVKGKRFIYFVELKTTLSVEYILNYKEKCKVWMNVCPEIANIMKFVIAGCYGNDDLMICANKPHECEMRRKMKTKIYEFDIDIDDHKKLHCFTEPNFSMLKEKISRIFI